jgi:hypothetical protein
MAMEADMIDDTACWVCGTSHTGDPCEAIPKPERLDGKDISDVQANFYMGAVNSRTGETVSIYRLTTNKYVVVIDGIVLSHIAESFDRAERLYNMKAR